MRSKFPTTQDYLPQYLRSDYVLIEIKNIKNASGNQLHENSFVQVEKQRLKSIFKTRISSESLITIIILRNGL